MFTVYGLQFTVYGLQMITSIGNCLDVRGNLNRKL